jgi:acetolactate synthase small subunit
VEVLSKEMAKLQHLQKLVEEVGTAEVCQTGMITGDFEISG